MSVLRIVFTAFMLIFPAGFTLFYRPKRDDIDRALLRRRRIALWVGTAAAVGLYALLLAGRQFGWFAFWGGLPRYSTWSAQPDEIAWILFFPLWFALAMRVLAASRPESTSPFPAAGARRSASLVPRSVTSPIPRSRWVILWAVFGLATAAVVAHLLFRAPHAGISVIALLLGGALPLFITPWSVRLILREPEPLDARGSPELVQAYARHRRTKAFGMYWLAVAMVGLCCGMAVAATYWPDGVRALGWIGGIGGSLVGVCGAVFGVRASHDRMRIRRLLDELTAEEG